MAGGFGGDDEDFKNYENDEETEQDDELDEEDNDEEDEEEDEEDEETFEQKLEERKKKIDEQIAEKGMDMLDKIADTPAGPFVAATPKSQEIIKRAKKVPKLAPKLTSFFIKIAKQIVSIFSKIFSAIAPALPYIGIAALIVLAFIILVAVIFAIVMNASAQGMAVSQFGASGKHFYGTRLIYRDEEKASAVLLDEYVGVVSESIDAVANIVETEYGDEKYDIEIDLEISIPEEKFTTFTSEQESEFVSEYADLYQIVNKIADEVVKVDDAKATATTLVQKFEAIKFFGFNETINSSVSTILSNEIILKYDFSYTEQIEEGEEDDGSTATKEDLKVVVDEQVKQAIRLLLNQETYKVRSEKLFIKDCIFESEDERMSSSEEDYVMMMYLPKEQVTISYFAFNVITEDIGDLDLVLKNGDSQIPLKRDNGMDLSETGATGKMYMYNSNSSLNVTANATELFETELDDELKSELEKGMSFMQLIRSMPDYNKYFETSEDGEFLTVKKSGITLEFENATSKFKFVDEIKI